MSTALAIGAVTAVLRNIVDNGLVDASLGVGAPVKVSAVAPDLVKLDDAGDPPRLNFFLHRVSPNTGYRNADLPSREGGARLANPPLALNLHYLLTAYGREDLQAEILLGYGMHLLHQRPFLDRDTIRRALTFQPLDPTVLPAAFRDPPAARLADQVEWLKVTWEPLDGEELSRLWSATQSHYRPSAGYEVSVVLIQSEEPATSPLPVLDRTVVTTPALVPPFPAITAVEPPAGSDVAELGDTVTLRGHDLDGTDVAVRFTHRLVGTPHVIDVGTVTDPGAVTVTLPAGGGATWPAGVWTVRLSVVRPGETEPRVTNAVALPLAPTPDLSDEVVARDAATRAVTVTLDVVPHVRPEQQAVLAVGGAEAVAPTRTATADRLTFTFGNVPAGPAWVRLRVDGVASRLVDHSATPPSFLASRSLAVPP